MSDVVNKLWGFCHTVVPGCSALAGIRNGKSNPICDGIHSTTAQEYSITICATKQNNMAPDNFTKHNKTGA